MSDVDETKKDEVTEEEKVEAQTDEVDVQVDDEVTDKISSQTVEKLMAQLAAKDAPASQTPRVEAQKLGEEKLLEDDYRKFVGKQLLAKHTGNAQELSKLNRIAIAKSNYNNATTAADGGNLIPPEDFDSAVRRIEEQYGAARQGGIATRQVNSDGYTFTTGTNEVAVSEVGEATAANAVKPTYGTTTKNLRKFIATGIITRELLEDSAEDVVRDLEERFGRAFAKKEDQLVFTDTTSGLAKNSSTKAVAIGTTWGSNLDLSLFNKAIYQIPSPAANVAKWYFNRQAWYAITNTTTEDASSGSSVANKNGFMQNPSILDVANKRLFSLPVILTEVLSNAITTNDTTLGVLGALDREAVLIEKRGLVVEMFNTGVVKDAGGSDFNLLTQDSIAIRAIKRMNFTPYHADAFCLVGTGTVS